MTRMKRYIVMARKGMVKQPNTILIHNSIGAREKDIGMAKIDSNILGIPS